MERIARFICKRSRLIVIGVVIINLVALASLFRFSIDTDFLNFFTAGNPRAEEYKALNERYGLGESLSVLVEQDGSLMTEETLQRVLELQYTLEAVSGVDRVETFLPSEIILSGTTFEVDSRFIERHHDVLEDYLEDAYTTGQFLSDDYRSCIYLVELEQDVVAGDVLDSLDAIVDNETYFTLSLAGNEIISATLQSYLLRILCILPPCAIILVLSVFYFVLKNRKMAILSVIPAGLGALWTIGTVFWSGQQLNLVTVLSPIFVIVMGAADGLHYTSHYLDRMRSVPDPRQCTIDTLKMVGMPIFLTSITTMAGFASLTWTEVVAMRHMGIFISLGIGYAGLLSLFFLPSVVLRMNIQPDAGKGNSEQLSRIASLLIRYRKPVIAVFAVLIVVSAVYIPRLEVVSNQLMFFKENSSIRQTFDRVEKYFGGALPLNAEIISENGVAILRDSDFAEEVLEMERDMERLPGVQTVFSLFDMVNRISETATGNSDYPENPQMVSLILAQIDDDDLEQWAQGDGLRMIIRTEELESVNIAQLDDFLAQYSFVRRVSGMPVLFDEMNHLVVRSQIQSLGLALVVIFLMLFISIRRIKAALVAMVPILITIITILGMLSLTGYQLNVLTANLSAIAVGVGVDYAIHLISGIYYFRNQAGLDSVKSVSVALETTSKPILANAFGLAIGMSILFFSPLRIHVQAASVMWVAMVVSSMASLLLIPLFYSGKRG